MKNIWIIIFTAILFIVPVQQLFADVSQDTTASVTVSPRNSDYQFTFVSMDNALQFSQGKILTYQITYGASSSGNIASNIKIVADYSADASPDNTDVLNYVNGSATNAYNSTPSVIDIVNRTITWTIPSFPAGITDQVVSFQLITNSNYQGVSTVPITVTAKMNNQYMTLPTQSVHQSYIFDASFVTPTPSPSPTPARGTPTPIPGPTNTPAPGVNVIAMPTTVPTLSPISPTQSISITGITQNTGKIGISTSVPATVTVFYGTSPSNLSQSLSTFIEATYAEITIFNLVSQTNYYFQTVATTNSGNKITSDIFTFKTAFPSTPPSIENGTIVISNTDVIVSSQTTSGSIEQNITNQKSVTVVTKGSVNQFVLTFPTTQKIKSIQAIVRNKSILAINALNHTTESDTYSVAMIETEPGVYVAQILSPLIAGSYEVFAYITDVNGNIVEQKIAELRVISPFTVHEKGSGEPIDNARAYFYFYNTKTKKYEPLSKNYGNIENPSYSDATGNIHTILPKGKYQVQVGGLGYQQVQRNFELGAASGKDYPQIYLQKDTWNVFYILKYYVTAAGDLFTKIGSSIQGLSISLRFFNLIGLVTILGFIFINFLLFTFRTHISFQRIPVFFYHHMSRIFSLKIHSLISGSVIDENNYPLANATVYVVNPVTNDILSSTITNANGAFYVKNITQKKLLLRTIKTGYEELHTEVETTQTFPQNGLTLQLHKGENLHFSGAILSWEIIKDALGVLFETTLFLSIVLEFLFLSVFGFWKTMPFFALSLLNIFLWILYIRESLSKKII